jgi:hypothetical protein
LNQTNQCSNRCFVAKGPDPDGLPHKVTHNIHIEFRQHSTFIDAPVVAIIPTEAYIAACLHASRPHGHRRITDAWSGPNWALTIHHIGFKRLWECVSQGAPKWAKKKAIAAVRLMAAAPIECNTKHGVTYTNRK